MSRLFGTPQIQTPLSSGFRPAWVGDREFAREVALSGGGLPLDLALERDGGKVARFSTRVLPEGHPREHENRFHVERLVKMLVWQKGGFRLWISGCRELGRFLTRTYEEGGSRHFDAAFMAKVYGVDRFEVRTVAAPSELPSEREEAVRVGGHLQGCRIGFDAGGSDRKVAAVIDGREVFSQEVVWHPKERSDPRYHIEGITHSLELAAAHLPRVDAVGVSSAGIFVGNETKVASLFRKVSPVDFEAHIRTIYVDVCRRLFGDIPVEVRNDGDVTALAGSMSLGGAKRVLGIAMGTSEAVGYVNREGLISGWLNELAFAPVDYSPEGGRDAEWSMDVGVGCQYLSQDAVIRLAPHAGIDLNEDEAPGEKLRRVQDLLAVEDPRAQKIFETVGVFLGYGLLHYCRFYDIEHVLLLGRVTSGEGGTILKEAAQRVLKTEAPEFAAGVSMTLPDEASRRVGQSIAAASLPSLGGGEGAR